MKVLLFIIGLVFVVLGLGLTVHSWYAACYKGQIVEGSAYVGPFLLVVGIWRLFSSAAAVTPPAILRLVAVGVGVAIGFGNISLLKATFPGDQNISATNNH